MRAGAYLYLTVLSFENKKEVYFSPESLLEYCLPTNKLPLKTAYEEVQVGRLEARGEVFKRYYHLFAEQEIQDLVISAGLEIIEVRQAGENLIIKARKPII